MSSSEERNLPTFVQNNLANQAAADANMPPVDKDRAVFKIAGDLIWGDLNIFTAGLALDDLDLGPLRRGPVSTFFSSLDEIMATEGALLPTSACWDKIPSSATSIGDALWDEFRKDPTHGKHQHLLKHGPPSADGGATGSGKRLRKAPSRLSDYETDDDVRHGKAGSGKNPPSGKARQARGPRVTAPSRQASQPTITAAFAASRTVSGGSGARGRRVLPDEDEEDDEASEGSFRAPGQRSGTSLPQKKVVSNSKAAKSAKKTSSSASVKAKTTASGGVKAKGKNKLLAKKHPRRLDKAERRQLRNAKAGRADDSDEDMSDSQMADQSDEEMPHQAPVEEDEEGDADDSVLMSRPSKHDPRRPPPEEDKTCTRYFEFIDADEVVKVRRNTGATYIGIDEHWRCRMCDGVYTGHPESRSNLALHVNRDSNPAYCSRMYDPIDQRFAGEFQRPDEPPQDGLDFIDSPAGGSSADTTPSLRGRQQKLDHWVDTNRGEMIKLKVEEVRRLILEWVIVDNQPFTEPTRPAFQAIIRALAPSILPACTAPRTIRRDLEQAHKFIVDQAIGHLREHALYFSVSHDAWTSPSRRYSFLAFVVNYIDVDWSYRHFLLGFEVLEGAHTGASLAGHLIRVLTKHDILDLWTGVLVGDAASSNGRMADALQYDFGDDAGAEQLGEVVKHRRGDHLIYCYNHSLNRAMIDFYKALGVKASNRDDGGNSVLRALPRGEVIDDEDGGPEQDAQSETDTDSDFESDGESDSDDGGSQVDEDEDGDVDDDQRGSTSSARAPGKRRADAASGGDAEMGESQGSQETQASDRFVEVVDALLQGDAAVDQDPEENAANELFADLRCQLAPITEEEEEFDPDYIEGAAGASDSTGQKLASPVHRLAKIIKAIHSSSEARREFKKYMKKEYGVTKPYKVDIVPPKFSVTRWNSRQKQFRTALKIKAGLLLYAKNSKREAVTDVGLEATDFSLLSYITDITDYAFFQTMEFERSDGHACLILQRFGELLHAIGIELEHARKKTTETAEQLVNALTAMKTKVEAYQEVAMSTKSILLAAVLHPQYRLKTFQTDYPQKIEMVKKMLHDEVKQIKANSGQTEPDVAPKAKGKGKGKGSKKLAKYDRQLPTTVAVSITAEQTEVDAYLAGRHAFREAVPGSEVEGDTVLGWWRDNEAHLPTLALVARKYLASPGSTSEVERVFSRAGLYVSGKRPLGPVALQQLVVTSQLMKKGWKPFPDAAPSVTPVNQQSNKKKRTPPSQHKGKTTA
ncbi:hypothetical protein OC842_006900 [Tilletia horrida]|uniref:HAT C-terminal dimerisation domain-containing protein n=1 Tax=Tilletia horrida TaxID=155126 RepID=A0AAN6JHM6_9BASI|nr:hypothetical protein OC842_006900 [Tilletia horrida]